MRTWAEARILDMAVVGTAPLPAGIAAAGAVASPVLMTLAAIPQDKATAPAKARVDLYHCLALNRFFTQVVHAHTALVAVRAELIRSTSCGQATAARR